MSCGGAFLIGAMYFSLRRSDNFLHVPTPYKMQKKIVCLLLSAIFVACSPQNKSEKVLLKPRAVPERLREFYWISKQTSYSLFDCDTTVKEIRIWESVSRLTSTNAVFLNGNSVSSKVFYLANKNSDEGKEVIALVNCQEQIIDELSARKDSLFGSGFNGPSLILYSGAEAAIDSLFKLGFADMQSQPEAETQQVGDGIRYAIEVRRGNY